ncbi:glycosyltransferase [Leifsonia sp. AG29]|uniref:glycosyltransferase n=1 Tax=Leifsonia sp. AG29 TaxID=2598860 RepID=UPI00131AB99A|nr:glycosyltransferase [Leifsonia sp. AG29]
MTQLTIAYISSYAYASGTANDTRTNGLIRSMELAGFRVTQPDVEETRPAGRTQKLLARIPILRTVTMGSGVSAWLNSLDPAPDVVFVYGADPRFLRPARKWARSRKVPIVVEVVDWYEVRDGVTLGQKFFTAVTNLWSMPREAARCDAAVVASTALEDYFGARGLACLRIPAIMDAAVSESDSPPRSSSIKLVYAGSPGLRDRKTLDNISRLPESDRLAGMPLQVDVVGVVAPEASESRPNSTVTIRYHGRVPRDAALALTARADFSVLQRDPSRRFAKAGFPSKVAESLLLGTPVLSNLSSDLGEYLRDEQNAVILDSDTYDALVEGVARAVHWRTSVEPDRRKIAASAAEVFSPMAYPERLSELLHSVAGRREE